jgi:predicted NAD/FAD-dependent oxidoreductase
MEVPDTALRVSIVGAGIAGATCAAVLSAAGHRVTVFDKAHGPGGRLATRRAVWTDRDGQPRSTPLDHGAPGFTAESAGFRQFVAEAERAGRLVRWKPHVSPSGLPVDGGGTLVLPTPDMPTLCRELLEHAGRRWDTPIDAVQRVDRLWRLRSRGGAIDADFDAVLLALPPAQAAVLLAGQATDWSEAAARVPMSPCWTLMGVAQATATPIEWDLARPVHGRLAWLSRNEMRPGRERRPGEVHWVVHANTAWSRDHLEQPGQWIQAELQAALHDWLGEPLRWRHAVVHRWRYALPPAALVAPPGRCWWNRGTGLGVCGDFLGGRGVEGAWLSGSALAAAVLGGSAGSPELGQGVHSDRTDLEPIG